MPTRTCRRLKDGTPPEPEASTLEFHGAICIPGAEHVYSVRQLAVLVLKCLSIALYHTQKLFQKLCVFQQLQPQFRNEGSCSHK